MTEDSTIRARYTISTAPLEPTAAPASQSLLPGSLLALAQKPPLSDILNRVIADAATLVDAARSTLYLLDAACGELVAVSTTVAVTTSRIPLSQGIIGWVASNRTQLISENLVREARYQTTDGQQVGSLVCTPLVEHTALLGVLVTASDRVHAFGSRHLTCINLLADYAAAALVQAQQSASGGTQQKQLNTLVEAARVITSLLEPREVFANIMAGMRQIVPYDDAIIFAFDAPRNELQVVAGQGTRLDKVRSERVSMADQVSFSVQVAQQRRARLYAPEAATHGGPITEYFLGGADLALLCVPLLSKETLRGVVTLARPKAFTPSDLRMMCELAPLVATALENITLYSAIKSDQERLAAIFAGTTEGIAVVDGEQRLVQTNSAFARLAGQVTELIGLPCRTAFAIPQRSASGQLGASALHSALLDALRGGRGAALVECEMPGLDPTQPRQVMASVAPILVESGFHAVLVVRDVTELRAVDRMKAQFLQMISHEIRSPLHTLNGYLDLALTGGAGTMDDKLGNIVRRARASGERLAGRVKDLLLLAHADAGYFTLQIAPTDVRRVITEATEEVELLANESAVTLRINLPTNLPTLVGDAERLEQVVRNLLSNAIKFTPRGGQVWVEARTEAHALELTVTDTGCGIASEHLPRIFERFYQVAADQGRARSVGQGLGLAIVKAIIERHGGWVQVASTPGQGSRFTIHLPIHANQSNSETTPLMQGAEMLL